MARRKHKARKTRKRSAYSACLSRALTGKKAKTKKAKRKNMKAALRKCGKLRR
jgi:hypothetical protein